MQQIIDMVEKKSSMEWVNKGEDMFKSLPHLPVGIVEFLVKIVPWLTLIGGLVTLLVVPLMSLGAIISLLTLNPLIVLFMIGYTITSLISGIIMLMAFKPLKDRKMLGWLLLFWSNVIGILMVLFGLFTSSSSLGSVVGVIFGFYLLYEIKPAFNGSAKK